MQIEQVAISELIPYARNSRTHSDEQVAQIAASIKEFGWTNPILIDGESGIIAGHGRLLAARKLGMKEVPVIQLSGMTDTQKRAYIIADNKLALNAGWDDELLRLELGELDLEGFDLELTGFTQEEIDALNPEEHEQGEAQGKGNLSDRFMIPPFSVLNAREGWWQDRKRAWIATGIQSEVGRSAKCNASGATFKGSKSSESDLMTNQTSIFDPVVCEIAYRWFSPVGGMILDPFAGGSVRGIVASKLGRQYIGHELRQEQVDANRKQGGELCGDDEFPPAWIAGDSLNIDKTCADVHADMVFSCPPYADLEVYSDNPKDLSTMKYADFKTVYFEIIKKACDRLKPDSFACFVVGEVRDKKGNYIDFVGDTVQAFRDAGLSYYNEAILTTCVGNTSLTTSRNFPIARKLGKTHQNVLVFVKGDGKKAAQRCGDVEIDESMFDSIDVVSDDDGVNTGDDS